MGHGVQQVRLILGVSGRRRVEWQDRRPQHQKFGWQDSSLWVQGNRLNFLGRVTDTR